MKNQKLKLNYIVQIVTKKSVKTPNTVSIAEKN